MALAGEGVDLVINARTKSELDATAEEIRKKYGVKVTAVAVDVTTEDGRKQVLAACPEPDIMRAARRREISASGTATTGSRRSTPTC